MLDRSELRREIEAPSSFQMNFRDVRPVCFRLDRQLVRSGGKTDWLSSGKFDPLGVIIPLIDGFHTGLTDTLLHGDARASVELYAFDEYSNGRSGDNVGFAYTAIPVLVEIQVVAPGPESVSELPGAIAVEGTH